MMAADSSLLTVDDGKLQRDAVAHYCTKLVRVRDEIIGAAGDGPDCTAFLEYRSRRTKPPKLKHPNEFYALVLTRAGRLFMYAESVLHPDEIKDGIAACGSGASFALAAMETMRELGHDPHPRLAVEVATRRDPYSKPPIDFLSWK